MRLSIQLNNVKKGKELAKFLRTIEYVKSVDIEEDTLTPLDEEEWIMPGRPATEEEIEILAEEMDKEEGGVEAKEFFKGLKKKLGG